MLADLDDGKREADTTARATLEQLKRRWGYQQDIESDPPFIEIHSMEVERWERISKGVYAQIRSPGS